MRELRNPGSGTAMVRRLDKSKMVGAGTMAELVDAADLKSADGNVVRVQVPLVPLFEALGLCVLRRLTGCQDRLLVDCCSPPCF